MAVAQYRPELHEVWQYRSDMKALISPLSCFFSLRKLLALAVVLTPYRKTVHNGFNSQHNIQFHHRHIFGLSFACTAMDAAMQHTQPRQQRQQLRPVLAHTHSHTMVYSHLQQHTHRYEALNAAFIKLSHSSNAVAAPPTTVLLLVLCSSTAAWGVVAC